MKKLWLSVCLVLSLLMPALASAATFEVTLPSTYLPADASWYLRCAVGTATKAIVAQGVGAGSSATFTLGSPGQDVHCEGWTAKGSDSSQLSAEVIVHIPLVLATPVFQLVLQP